MAWEARVGNRCVIKGILTLLTWGLVCSAAQASSCRLALVLALDVSASVDEREYELQLEGVARSLESHDVRKLLLHDSSAYVALSVFEWGSVSHKVMVLPWTKLYSPSAIDHAVAQIRQHSEFRPGFRTGLGAALGFGADLLSQRPECWRHKIDVSGDGKNNVGPSPAYVRRLPPFADVVINALVILEPGKNLDPSNGHYDKNFDLRGYFDDQVIWGPDAFTIAAYGYEQYADSMRRKLLKELQLPVMGWLFEKSGASSQEPPANIRDFHQ